MRFSKIRQFALDLLFPKQCFGCKKEGTLLCPECKSKLVVVPPSCFVCKKWVPETIRVNPGRTCKTCQSSTHIYAFFSPFEFGQETVRELIHELKYKRVRSIGNILGELLAEYCQKFNVDFPEDLVIIPLSLHNWRERRRGFNQSELIAGAFAENMGIETLRTDILKRTKKTKPQVELSGENRRQNIVGAFTVNDSTPIEGKQILLIDDVKTTGATLEEAARVLREAGAKRVWAMTVAH